MRAHLHLGGRTVTSVTCGGAILGPAVSVGSAGCVKSAQTSAARCAMKALLVIVGDVAGSGW